MSTPFGEQVRHAAIATRMFITPTPPWQCDRHELVEVKALGRSWQACSCCGYVPDPRQRWLLMSLWGPS